MYFDTSKVPFTTRNRTGLVQSVHWKTYALMNGFISNAQLSESKGDELLSMMKDLFQINQSKMVGLSTNYRTITNACNKNVDSLFEIVEWNKSLTEEFFGTLSIRGDNLKQVRGAFYPIIDRIKEILLVARQSILRASLRCCNVIQHEYSVNSNLGNVSGCWTRKLKSYMVKIPFQFALQYLWTKQR
jgi:hypothetical protein